MQKSRHKYDKKRGWNVDKTKENDENEKIYEFERIFDFSTEQTFDLLEEILSKSKKFRRNYLGISMSTYFFDNNETCFFFVAANMVLWIIFLCRRKDFWKT